VQGSENNKGENGRKEIEGKEGKEKGEKRERKRGKKREITFLADWTSATFLHEPPCSHYQRKSAVL
jgi:hypothetical protein